MRVGGNLGVKENGGERRGGWLQPTVTGGLKNIKRKEKRKRCPTPSRPL